MTHAPDAAEQIAEAIIRELRRQDDADPRGLVFDVDGAFVGIDGYVNLREIARVVLETMEQSK